MPNHTGTLEGHGFTQLDLEDRHVIDATGSPGTVTDAVLTALRAGRLAITGPPSG